MLQGQKATQGWAKKRRRTITESQRSALKRMVRWNKPLSSICIHHCRLSKTIIFILVAKFSGDGIKHPEKLFRLCCSHLRDINWNIKWSAMENHCTIGMVHWAQFSPVFCPLYGCLIILLSIDSLTNWAETLTKWFLCLRFFYWSQWSTASL